MYKNSLIFIEARYSIVLVIKRQTTNATLDEQRLTIRQLRAFLRNTDDVALFSDAQIELDLLRTLPNNRFYENEFADNIIRLRRVLLAFAVHNKEISYCQVPTYLIHRASASVYLWQFCLIVV